MHIIIRHSYYGRLMRTRMYSYQMELFAVTLSDPNYPKPPYF